MALWTWNGADWEKAAWQRLSRPDPCVIFGSAPSLDAADKDEKGCFRIVLNDAYKKVMPHLYVAMDKPDYPHLQGVLDLPCRKVYRGQYSECEGKGGRKAKEFGDVYFADIEPGEKGHVFYRRDRDAKFLWLNNTLTVSVHLAVWMGFKKIIFSGIDLTMGRFEGGTSAAAERQSLTATLRDQEFAFLKWFAASAPAAGIEVVNRSETSRLREFIKTEGK